MHVDKNLAEAPVGIFAGAKVNLMASNARLLGVTAAPVRQALSVVPALLAQPDGGGGL